MSLGHTIARRLAVAAVIAALAASACSSTASSGEGDDAAPAAPSAAPEDRTANRDDGAGRSDAPAPEASAPAPDAAVDALAPTPGAGPAPGSGKLPGPPPTDFPYETTLRVKSTLTPDCVAGGERIKLEVTTKPEAAIGYHAIYADGYGGSDAPFGRGYGGNDKGFASDDAGTYTSSWIVSPTAPPGPARVDVVIGFEGKWGYDTPHFAVADAKGDCPRAWLNDAKSEAK